jgi:pimeloyl-ACP methyl ester carboxylesterase
MMKKIALARRAPGSPHSAPCQMRFAAKHNHACVAKQTSWMLVAANDRTINPGLEQVYANRAHSHTVEVAGASHAVYVSHPKEVADVIERAARAISK